ncbi:hypothetical protein WAI453_011275 [Rhynchosporium graminicola]|uniref:Uncharacterized protein n=1 Tax=Rhynchosporium graminicola TaxID=2792576 RepID=A0A1E1KB59_9HELO|nr:uncharacterized protein RCO7_05808 [Rhynchosporium commune]
MNSAGYKYSYISQLPLMFTLIDGGRDFGPSSNGLTKKQQQLWATVGDFRDRVLQDPVHYNDDPTVQQYMLELWTWNQYWYETPFPGHEPEKIEVEDMEEDGYDPASLEFETAPEYEGNIFAYTPSAVLTQYHPFNSDSEVDHSQGIHAHHSLSSPTRHYPTIQPISEESLRTECREAILQHKGPDYIPYHGWDEETGIPRYSILCLASNGFFALCGPRSEYFRVVKQHFSSTARIMYQRARNGLMVIWIEAPRTNHVVEFRENVRMWNAFKACWAFLKCWSDAAGEGGADNIADFLMGWRGDERVGEVIEMEYPPLQVYNPFRR